MEVTTITARVNSEVWAIFEDWVRIHGGGANGVEALANYVVGIVEKHGVTMKLEAASRTAKQETEDTLAFSPPTFEVSVELVADPVRVPIVPV